MTVRDPLGCLRGCGFGCLTALSVLYFIFGFAATGSYGFAPSVLQSPWSVIVGVSSVLAPVVTLALAVRSRSRPAGPAAHGDGDGRRS